MSSQFNTVTVEQLVMLGSDNVGLRFKSKSDHRPLSRELLKWHYKFKDDDNDSESDHEST